MTPAAAPDRDARGHARNDHDERFAPFARYYTTVAEGVLGRQGVAVRVIDLGPTDAGPVALTDLATRTIVLNAALLGPPESLSRDEDSLSRMAVVEGVLRREIGRLEHSSDLAVGEGALGLSSAMALLEEIRIEARTAALHPSHVRWMRTAASALDLATLDLTSFNASFRTISAATLTLGRIHAGTLERPDIIDLVELFRTALGDEVFDALDSLFAEVVRIEDGEVPKLADAARRLLDLVGHSNAAEITAVSGHGHGPTDGTPANDASAPESRAQPPTAKRGNRPAPHDGTPAGSTQDTDSKKRSVGLFGDAAIEISTRPPTEPELVERNRMAKVFRTARFREREMTEVRHSLPPGQLRVSGLVQRDAALALGALSSSAPAFQLRRRRHVDEPILSVGLVVDTSGSMSGKERHLNSALFTLSGAVIGAGGRFALGAFGDGFTPVASPSAPLRGVPALVAQGGTAHLGEAIDFVAATASLTQQRHVRQLYVLSDGQWEEKDEIERRFIELRRIGCSVFVIDFGSGLDTLNSNVQLSVKDVSHLSEVLFHLFEKSFREAG